MAPLTWREVAAPNFSGVSESQRLAASLLDKGLGAATDALSGFQKTRNDAASSSFLSRVAGYGNDPAALDAALKSGQIFDGLNRSQISPEALQYGAQRQGALLDYAGKDLSNQNQSLVNVGQGTSNEANAFNLTAAQRNDAQAQARLAAQPEAAKLLASARTLAGSGDPAKVEQSRTLLADNTKTLIAAGYQADAIPGLLDAERGAGTAGFGYKKDLLADQKFWENNGVTEDARKIAQDQINANASPDAAIRAIQDNRQITDPRIKAQAIQVIQQATDSKVFSQPDQAQMLLQSITGVPGSVTTAPAPVATNAAPAGAGSNPLVALVDRTEGGGRYDTLFGHSQKNGGAFSGVDVSKMTLDQLGQLDEQYGPWVKNELVKQGQTGRIATPMGRFQIVGDTRRRVAKEMGLSGDTVFNADTQNAMFNHLVDNRLSGPRSMEGKIQGLRQEWEGFKSVPDDVLAKAITAYQNGDKGVLTGITQGGGGAAPNAQAQAAPLVAPVAAAPAITQPVGVSPAAQLTSAVVPSQAPTSANANAVVPAGTPAAAAAVPAPVDPNGPLGGWFAPPGASGFPEQVAAPVVDQAAQLAASAVPPTAMAPAVPAPVSLPNQVQTALDQNTLDRVFNGNGSLIDQVTNQKYANETPSQTAARLVGEGGSMPGGNPQEVLQAIKDTIKLAGGNLDPQMAGALVAKNADSRDLTSGFDLFPWVDTWFDGDRFSNPNESLASATRTNMDGVAEDLKQLGKNVDGSIDLSKGTSQVQNARASAVSATQLAQVQGLLLQTTNEVAAIQAAIQNGQDTPQNRAALAKKMGVIQQLQAVISQVGNAPSPTTIFSRAATRQAQ